MLNRYIFFADLGDLTSLTARMWAQLAMPVSAPFCSLVRPCTVSALAPAPSIILAYATVRSTDSKTLSLQVTGARSAAARTRDAIRSHSSCRKEPKWPRRAITCQAKKNITKS